jgi:iron complex outermembrane receptor protein
MATFGTAWSGRRALLLASALASAGCLVPAACAAAAASASAEAPVSVNEVVVTAEKRETKLQDTPIAVTAFTSDTIEKNRIEHLEDVATRTPNVVYTQFSNEESYFSIRGTLINNNAAGWDDAVATFVDDVPTTGLGDVDPNLFDLQSIEVLRGPQGTLFGRNATGGVVLIRTQPPSFTPMAKVEGTYGSNNLVQLRGVFSGPLVADTLAGKIAISLDHRDDFIRNVTLHDKTAGVNQADVRGQLLWDVKPNLNVLVSADYLIDRSGGYPTKLTGNFIPALFPTLSYDPETTNQGINGEQDRDIAGLSARVTWNGRWGTLTSISGFRYVDARFPNTIIGDPENQLPTVGLVHDTQFSQELRWASPADRRLTWVAGAFALHSDKREGGPIGFFFDPNTVAGIFSVNDYTQVSDQKVATDSFALFGEATFDITHELKLTLGARGTDERKAGTSVITYSRVDPGLYPGSAAYSHTWSAFTPKATLSWQPTTHLMTYLTVAEGFKSGGYDLSGSGGSSVALVDAALATPFNPETVWNYEVGEKFTGFDNRFTFDADVFADEYLHLQTSQLVIINSVPIPITSDAGNARVAGIEVESTALPTNWLTLGLTYAAMDTKFLSHKANPPLYGDRIPYAPKQQVHASAEVHFPVSSLGGTVAIGGDYTYHSKVFFDNANTAPLFLQRKSVWHHIVDVYANYTSQDEKWKLAVWAKNLTNEHAELHAADVTVLFENLNEFLGNAGSVFLAKYYPERTVGVTLTRTF